MPPGMRLRALALALCVTAATSPPRSSLAQESSAANVVAARKHFDRARAYYGKGAYREAISELEAAHTLDPNAKDLVFNLGVVHEKLADIDEALRSFRQYTTMDLTLQEREKADAYIRRLEGAKKEMEQKQAAAQPVAQPAPEPPVSPSEPAGGTSPTQSPSQPVGSPSAPEQRPPAGRPAPASPGPPGLPRMDWPPSPAAKAPGGRVDALTVTTASASAAALAFGIVMAVMAKADRPAGGARLGVTFSGQDYKARVDDAFREAVLADVGFGVALVSGVATAYLYFARPKTTPPAAFLRTATSMQGSTHLVVAPLSGGGTLLLKGRF